MIKVNEEKMNKIKRIQKEIVLLKLENELLELQVKNNKLRGKGGCATEENQPNLHKPAKKKIECMSSEERLKKIQKLM